MRSWLDITLRSLDQPVLNGGGYSVGEDDEDDDDDDDDDDDGGTPEGGINGSKN